MSETCPLVSVVVLNYNGLRFVGNCLRSALSSNYPNFELVFVDNASNDGSFEWAQTIFSSDPRLKFIRNDRNLGFAAGNNVALKFAVGKYVVFLSIDTKVDPGWLRELVRVMESDPKIGVAQSKIIDSDDPSGICAGWAMDRYGFSYGVGGRKDDLGRYDRMFEVFAVGGAAMAARKDFLEKMGSFDPCFFLYAEDTDLCWRAWIGGYRVVFVPKSVVLHVGRGVSKGLLSSVGIYLSCKNHAIMLLKNYELHNAVRRFSVYSILMMFLAGYFFSRRKLDKAMACIRGILWNITNFRCIWTQRLTVQRARVVADEEIDKKLLPRPNFGRLISQGAFYTRPVAEVTRINGVSNNTKEGFNVLVVLARNPKGAHDNDHSHAWCHKNE